MKLGITSMALCLSQMAMADGIYTIYPVPQQQVAVKGSAKLTTQVNVILEKRIDEATKLRLVDVLKQHQIEAVFSDAAVAGSSNIYLGVNGSGEQADQFVTAQNLDRAVFQKANKFDRHCVALSADNGLAQVVILGENTDATFFGIASLEQMLDNDLAALPCIKIYDYADQKSRGIVEGYYGYPYTVEVKKDLMRYMMRFKMNTYMYGAKSDPYHSGYWKQPYPTSLTEQQKKNGWLSQDMVKDLTKVSHDTKVNFIWAIHPGNDIMNNGAVVRDVMSKFDKMYHLGVRQFAVFVDDVGVPNADAEMARSAQNVAKIQKEIEKKYNVNYTAAVDTVRPLHFVPQVYCSSWVGEDQRKRFFKSLKDNLPQNVTVYTTGWGVWSVPNQGDFNLTARELGRPAAWWWNYPCNDNADAQVFPMDMYNNFYDMPSVDNNAKMPRELNNSFGIVSNPMQQGEISKIPIFSVADYAWNTSDFNNIKSWNAAFPAMVGKEKAAALQAVAQYIRWNDPDQLNALINSFKRSLEQGRPNITKLKETLDEVYQACLEVEGLKDSEVQSDRLLYNDLAPWLLKLKQMCKSSSDLLLASVAEDGSEEKWNSYVGQIAPVAGLDSAERYKVYSLEGMGENPPVGVRQSAAARRYLYPFTKYLKEKALGNFFKPVSADELSFISNAKNLNSKVVVVNDSVGFNTAAFTLNQGEYVGFALPNPRKISDVVLADSLVANHNVLYSSNGKIWKNFADKESFLNDYVKYFCVKNNTETPVALQLPLSVFSVILGDPVKVEKVSLPNGPIWDDKGYVHDEKLMVDGDYSTFTCLYRCQQNGDKYTLTLNKMTPIHDVRVCMGTVNGDHMNSGYVEISEDGKSWKKIVVKGTSIYDFTINMSQAVQYSNEMKYCDFDGKGVEAKFVRFCVKSPRTDKWLRFYEMEVNKQFENPVASASIPSGRIWQNHNKEFIYDGNPSTFVCLDKNQSHGDKYTLKLKEPTEINGIRVYMGTTNGDHMNKGNIEVSKDGKTWKKLYVKGTKTYDFTMEMPETVKFSDEVYYCDFEGTGEEVQQIRFVVKDARTNKWLRLYEIALNPNDQTNLDVCVANDGSTITSLNDALGHTGIQNINQSLTYYFNSLNLMKAVEIYSDASVNATASVKVTSDGETWNDYGSLSLNKKVVDLSNQSDAIAMKIEWNGTHSPAIYEIVPVLDGESFAEVTKVEQLVTSKNKINFAFNAKQINIEAPAGIASVDMFTFDGKAVMKHQAAGKTKVILPVIGKTGVSYVVRVVLINGEFANYKLYCK